MRNAQDTLLKLKTFAEHNIMSGSINLIDNHGKTEFKSWQDKNKPDPYVLLSQNYVHKITNI